ncbi:hypothetical protein GCM10020218_069590 [Dactylosporangium vinaceum]
MPGGGAVAGGRSTRKAADATVSAAIAHTIRSQAVVVPVWTAQPANRAPMETPMLVTARR